jgi:hypothetical protein
MIRKNPKIINVIIALKIIAHAMANGIMKKNANTSYSLPNGQKKHLNARIVERDTTPETVCGTMSRSARKMQQLNQQAALQSCVKWTNKSPPQSA